MKKLLTAFAACMIAVVASADLYSNIVGYQALTLTEKNTMLGCNFQTVVDGAAIPITDLIPKTTIGLNAGAASSDADNIQILTPTGYEIYYLCNGNIGKGGSYVEAADGWVKFGEAAVTTASIGPGEAFWFVSQSASPEEPLPLTISGEVAIEESSDKTLAAGLTMIANRYPVDIAFADPSVGLTVGKNASGSSDADNIQILTSTGYEIYYLCDGNIGKGGSYVEAADGWVKFGEAVVTEETIPAGSAAWYVNRGATFTWTCPRPFSID